MIRDPSDGSIRELCMCKACQADGFQHFSDCAVHNGPALSGGICTCAMGRGLPDEPDRLSKPPPSGLPFGSTKPDKIARLEKSREWLREYLKTKGE